MTDQSCNNTTKCVYSTKQPKSLFIVHLNVEEESAAAAAAVVVAVAAVVVVQDIWWQVYQDAPARHMSLDAHSLYVWHKMAAV